MFVWIVGSVKNQKKEVQVVNVVVQEKQVRRVRNVYREIIVLVLTTMLLRVTRVLKVFIKINKEVVLVYRVFLDVHLILQAQKIVWIVNPIPTRPVLLVRLA